LLQGQLKGDQTLDYRLRAGAGQTLMVDIRRANNNATVVVTNPEGQKRQFLLVQSKAVAADQPAPLAVQRRGDVSLLRLGDNFELDEIVDALVLAG
jgi:hypothetical protein